MSGFLDDLCGGDERSQGQRSALGFTGDIRGGRGGE
jgi:hypothetical protein